jgi:hypothetical protein
MPQSRGDRALLYRVQVVWEGLRYAVEDARAIGDDRVLSIDACRLSYGGPRVTT